uniref:Transthyretin-like family protein n=1 Tax=Anisakis simplex TaxID=6269 RepID=A0A0M3IZE1_ANISI
LLKSSVQMKQAIFLLLCVCLSVCLAMRQQAVHVKGQLMCGNQPARNVKVKLWDEDEGPDPDDVLDEGTTDSTGHFELEGSTRELTSIDPIFKIYHDCDDGIKVTEMWSGVVLLLLTLVAFCTAVRHQSVGVRGKLLCGSAPARNVRVKLWEEDSGDQAIRDQSVAVTGKFLCGTQPAANYRIKLWEEDRGPDPDDLLAQGYTDNQGQFHLQGGESELTTIDPVFKIYHDCDDGF